MFQKIEKYTFLALALFVITACSNNDSDEKEEVIPIDTTNPTITCESSISVLLMQGKTMPLLIIPHL